MAQPLIDTLCLVSALLQTQHPIIKTVQLLWIKHIVIDFGSALAPTWSKPWSCQNLAWCQLLFTVMEHHTNSNIGCYPKQLLLLISSAVKEDTIFTVWKDSKMNNYAYLMMFNFCLRKMGGLSISQWHNIARMRGSTVHWMKPWTWTKQIQIPAQFKDGWGWQIYSCNDCWIF